MSKSISELQNVRDALELALWQTSFITEVISGVHQAEDKSGLYLRVKIAECIIPENIPLALNEITKVYRGDSSMIGWNVRADLDSSFECFITWDDAKPLRKPPYPMYGRKLQRILGEFSPVANVEIVAEEEITLIPGNRGLIPVKVELDPSDNTIMIWVEPQVE